MGKVNLRLPSPALVVALIALSVSLAGNAGAFSRGHKHQLVRKGDIAPGAVTARALAAGAVHPRALAEGAVTPRALAKEAVRSAALAKGAVGVATLAEDAVTSSALAPGSVYGGALGPVTFHGTPIADLDESADLSTWTASNSEVAMCGPGERLLTGGVVFTNPGNRRVGVIESLPFSNGITSGMVGRITSDSGGTAAAEVQALCLK